MAQQLAYARVRYIICWLLDCVFCPDHRGEPQTTRSLGDLVCSLDTTIDEKDSHLPTERGCCKTLGVASKRVDYHEAVSRKHFLIRGEVPSCELYLTCRSIE